MPDEKKPGTKTAGTALVGGKYQILQRLGSGGAGQVYQVLDVRLDKIWAAKRVDPGNPGMEEKVLSRVDGSLFPRIVDIAEEADGRYLVMDWIDGETLEKRLKKKGAFSADDAAAYAVRLCDALNTLHTMEPPLLYLDCKPSNVMVDRDERLWLIDFGSAVEQGEPGARPIAASPGYAAPELLASVPERRRADVRSDVFGLGRTLYALLGGPDPARPPYGVCPLTECCGSVPEELAKIVERCTKREPEKRYQTVAAVRSELEDFLRRKRKDRSRKAAVFAVTLLLSGVTLWRGWLFYRMLPVGAGQYPEALRMLGSVLLCAGAAAVWQRTAGGRMRRGPVYEPLQSVLRTEKQPGRWLAFWLAVGLCAAPPQPDTLPAAEPARQTAVCESAPSEETESSGFPPEDVL